jgi:DNA-binding NarL/FixJ family response regulator
VPLRDQRGSFYKKNLISLRKEKPMKICLIHERRIAREVLARALSSKLGAEVTYFSCCERALASSLDYDVFVVYNNFRRKMSGIRGVTKIRGRNPDAFIIGVSSTPNLDQRFLPAGADAFVLRAGNEVQELVSVIRRKAGLSASTNLR